MFKEALQEEIYHANVLMDGRENFTYFNLGNIFSVVSIFIILRKHMDRNQ